MGRALSFSSMERTGLAGPFRFIIFGYFIIILSYINIRRWAIVKEVGIERFVETLENKELYRTDLNRPGRECTVMYHSRDNPIHLVLDCNVIMRFGDKILLLSKDANSTSKIGFRAIRTFKIGSEEEDDNETKYYDFEIELKNGDYIEFSFIEE